MKIDNQKLKEELKDIMGEEPIFYLKFTKEKDWGKDIVNGRIYMNTIQYFRDLEKKMLKQGQGDKNELKQKFRFFNMKIIDPKTNKTLMAVPEVNAKFEYTEDADVFLFCMLGVTVDDLEIVECGENFIKVTPSFLKNDINKIKEDFGENVVFINGPMFRKLINEKIEGRELEAILDKVIYCEQNNREKMEVFSTYSNKRFLYKDNIFAYQKESRLAIDKKYIKNHYLELGSLANISFMCTIEKLIRNEYKIRTY
jgi:hypothetical protein